MVVGIPYMTLQQYIFFHSAALGTCNLQALNLFVLWCCLPICFVCFLALSCFFYCFCRTLPCWQYNVQRYDQMLLTMFPSYQGHIWLLSWVSYVYSLVMRKPVYALCEQHRCSAFIVQCLDSIVPILSKSKISKLQLTFCSCAGRFESYLIAILEARCSRDVA